MNWGIRMQIVELVVAILMEITTDSYRCKLEGEGGPEQEDPKRRGMEEEDEEKNIRKDS